MYSYFICGLKVSLITVFIFSQSIQASARTFVSELLCDDAYLCYQPLDSPELLDLWQVFAGRCSGESRKLSKELVEVFNILLGSLETAVPNSINDESQEAAAIYLASSNEELKTIEELMAAVEMLMSSHVSIGLKFFTHIGIARSPFAEDREKHPGVSMYLHSFGARMIDIIYNGEKLAMITSPLDIMANIFVENLGVENITFSCLLKRTTQDLASFKPGAHKINEIVSYRAVVGGKEICKFKPYTKGRTPIEWYLSNKAFSTNLNRYAGILTEVLAGWSDKHPYGLM